MWPNPHFGQLIIFPRNEQHIQWPWKCNSMNRKQYAQFNSNMVLQWIWWDECDNVLHKYFTWVLWTCQSHTTLGTMSRSLEVHNTYTENQHISTELKSPWCYWLRNEYWYTLMSLASWCIYTQLDIHTHSHLAVQNQPWQHIRFLNWLKSNIRHDSTNMWKEMLKIMMSRCKCKAWD